jgi:hypothetical protein
MSCHSVYHTAACCALAKHGLVYLVHGYEGEGWLGPMPHIPSQTEGPASPLFHRTLLPSGSVTRTNQRRKRCFGVNASYGILWASRWGYGWFCAAPSAIGRPRFDA